MSDCQKAGMLLSVIKTRRSTRRFKDAELPQDMLDMIIEAGRYAPSGGNNQKTHFLVMLDKALLSRLKELTNAALVKVEEEPGMYRSFLNSVKGAKKAAEEGKVRDFYYEAPVLILTASDENYYNRFADCACAIENMMLTANALDLGSCWINTVRFVQDDPELNEFLREVGMKEGEVVCGGVAIGFADTEDGLPAREPLPRTGNLVELI